MMKKIKFSFLDRFKRKTSKIDSTDEILEERSDEILEEIKDEILEEIKDETSKQNLNETNSDLPTEHSIATKEENTFKEPITVNIEVEELPPPERPKLTNKLKYKFPSFGSDLTSKKIKEKNSAKSPLKSLQKFNWNDFILLIFSPYTRGKIHYLFILILVATVTFMLGKNIAMFFNKTTFVAKTSTPFDIPLEKAETTGSDIKKIISINLFNAKENDKVADNIIKKNIDSIICLDAETPTKLQIKLLDTIVLQDSVKSVASVQVRGSSDLQNVRVGENLEKMAEVVKINRFKMILKNLETGDCEYAATESEQSSAEPDIKIMSKKGASSLFKSLNPNIKNVGNSFKIKKTFRDSMITNMSDILTQAKAIQIMNPDGSLCFKMTEVVKGSLYSQLNIQEDDIICNINGKKIENLNDLMGLLGKIKEIDQFQLGLKRNGMSENLDYGFE